MKGESNDSPGISSQTVCVCVGGGGGGGGEGGTSQIWHVSHKMKGYRVPRFSDFRRWTHLSCLAVSKGSLILFKKINKNVQGMH